MSETLVIVGAGGHGSVVAETAELMGRWKSIVFFDDHKPKGSNFHNWQVIGSLADLIIHSDQFSDCVVAVGKNSLRHSICHRLLEKNLQLVSIVHPTAIVSPNCTIGDGCAILAGAVVNIGSRIGMASIVNNAATVNHDCEISPGVHIGPNVGIGGNVSIGKESWIGIGANVIHRIRIGRNVIVGSGAAVVDHIEDSCTVVGVPAKPVKRANLQSVKQTTVDHRTNVNRMIFAVSGIPEE